MRPVSFFNHLRIKYKLALAFCLLVIPLLALAGLSSYCYIKGVFIQNTKSELRNSTDALVKMVDTAASVAIKNYLRAVAEKNIDILNNYFDAHQKGDISLAQMRKAAVQLLQAQTIGQTGYIYCINSEGVIALHPSSDLLGKSLVSYPFVQQQIQRKEGYLEYLWKNPHETEKRPKALYMAYFEPLDWIVSVSSYREEFNQLININDIGANVRALKLGDSGYAFILDKKNGEVLVHPGQVHLKSLTQRVADSDPLLKIIISQKRGDISHVHRNPDGGGTREILTYFDSIDNFGWVVCTSYFVNEIFEPLTIYKYLIITTILYVSGASMGIAFWFSVYVNGHIHKLIKAFEKGKKGSLTVRLNPSGKDELSKLGHYFNDFMDRLEMYQQHLHASEKKYRGLYESSLEGYIMVDRHLNIIEHNTAFANMLGYGERELVGKSITTILPTERLGAEKAFYGDGVGPSDNADLFEMDYICKDGRRLPTELRIHTLLDENRQPNAYWSFARNITERKAAEQEHLKLVMAVEQVADIIIITNTEGRIEYVNPAFERCSGYSKSEVIGQTPGILKSDKHDTAFYRNLWDTIRNGKVWSGRIINKKKDGSLFYEDAMISPMKNKDNSIIYYVASKRDVTHEVLLENQLRHSERITAMGILAGGITHDFNNILSGIMGYTEISKYEAQTGSKLHRRLEKILGACHRASDLIRHIQTFSRKTSIDPIPMLPGPLVKEALKLIQASYPVKIKINSCIDDVGVINAVPTQIHQIVMNLCTNACQAMQTRGGVLSVTLEKQYIDETAAQSILNISPGHYAKLSISDTGPGIPSDIMGKIFDPYFSTKDETENSGLGLSVVHGIVTEMNGAIWGYNEPMGGATFNVFLPVPNTGEDNSAKHHERAPLGSGQSVLLVDNEEDILQVTKEILESLNYCVIEKSSTIEALNLFSSKPEQFHIVICDYAARHMDGIRFAGAVKKISKDIPVIISSGFSSGDSLNDTQIDDLARLINKPIIRSDLAHLMAECLQKNPT